MIWELFFHANCPLSKLLNINFIKCIELFFKKKPVFIIIKKKIKMVKKIRVENKIYKILY